MSNTQTNQKMTAPVEVLEKPKFSVAVRTPGYQDLILSTLGDPEVARRFTAAIVSAVAINPALAACTPASVLAGALVGESLKLSPNPTVGHYYLVPRKSKAKYDKETNKLIEAECMKASYQTGYKGYIQLGLRSSQYKGINAIEVKQGELVSYNPFTEELRVNPIMDFEKRQTAPTIGYYVYFELVNGFRKSMYWSIEQMMRHANHYSDAFSSKDYAAIKAGKVDAKDLWKFSSNWYKDFDMMGRKTMIRQLIPVYGPMSIEMQTAYDMDEHVIAIENGRNLVPEAIDGLTNAFNELSAGRDETPEGAPVPEKEAPLEGQVVDLNSLK